MTTTFATRDEAAADRIRTHHAHLAADLDSLVTALGLASGDAVEPARQELVAWLRSELAPHADGEEETLYPAAEQTAAGRLLIAGMVAEHQVIRGLVDQIADSRDQHAAAAWGGALLRVFRSHADKENDLVLPLLVQEPEVDLQALLEQMHAAH